MAEQVFRQKSLDRLSSPESLNHYMQVTNTPVWIGLYAVIVLLAAILVWSGFAVIESRAEGTASVREGTVILTPDNPKLAEYLEAGMKISIGGNDTVLTYIGRDGSGQIVAGTEAEVPDGEYAFSAVFRTTRVMQLLFN